MGNKEETFVLVAQNFITIANITVTVDEISLTVCTIYLLPMKKVYNGQCSLLKWS